MSEKRIWRINWSSFRDVEGVWINWWGQSDEEAARAEALRKDAEEEAALEAVFRASHPNLF